MNSEQLSKVERLQDNLYTLRRLAGWNAEDIAMRLDVTKQTVYNLERGKPKMSWVQYLAIIKLIEIEIENHPDNTALAQAFEILLNDKGLSGEDLQELQMSLKTIAKGMTRTTDRNIGLKLALQTLGAATAGIATGVATKNIGAGLSTLFAVMDSLREKGNRDGQ